MPRTSHTHNAATTLAKLQRLIQANDLSAAERLIQSYADIEASGCLNRIIMDFEEEHPCDEDGFAPDDVSVDSITSHLARERDNYSRNSKLPREDEFKAAAPQGLVS